MSPRKRKLNLFGKIPLTGVLAFLWLTMYAFLMKQCKICRKFFNLENFYRIRTQHNKFHSECKFCTRERSKARVKRERKITFSRVWFMRRYSKLKENAKRRGILFRLTFDEFIDLRSGGNECVYCGTRDTVLSVDRKDNDLGYFKLNCALACLRCNKLKSNLFTYTETKLIGKELRKINAMRTQRERTAFV